jgi:hypothetical protein
MGSQLLTSVHAWTASGLLLTIVAVSHVTGEPIRSLIPYGIAVGIATWRHGLAVGLGFSGLAVIAALTAGAIATDPHSGALPLDEGLLAYMRLSFVAAAVASVRSMRNSQT